MNGTIQQQVNQAIAEGLRVQQAVQQIVLKALAEGRLDLDAMRKVTGDALAAVRVAEPGSAAKDAVRGIESALAHAADLAKVRADVAAVEKMFVATLSQAADAARGAAKATLEDLARHAEASGTAIGRQLRESAERLKNPA